MENIFHDRRARRPSGGTVTKKALWILRTICMTSDAPQRLTIWYRLEGVISLKMMILRERIRIVVSRSKNSITVTAAGAAS
jgi:hypothetical protein